MATEHEAPWAYRKRFTLFGAVYGAGFFFGYLIAGLAGLRVQPAFITSGHPAVFGTFALASAVAGWALRVWASSYLAGAVVWRQDVAGDTLRVAGPYRFTRNPLYVGNVLQAIGIGLLAPWIGFAMIVVGVVALCSYLVAVEEPFLARTYGDAYVRYRASVARFIPLPGKSMPPGTQRAALADGLRSEAMTAAFAIVTAVWLAVVWPR